MIEFIELTKNDFQDDCLVDKIVNVGNEVAQNYKCKIDRIEFERVAMDVDVWININFFAKATVEQLAKMNLVLASELVKLEDFLFSENGYIPSFTSEE